MIVIGLRVNVGDPLITILRGVGSVQDRLILTCSSHLLWVATRPHPLTLGVKPSRAN